MTTVTPNFMAPERSLEQRFAALELANDVRHRRAVLKRELHDERRGAAAVIVNPPDYVLTMRVWDLLLAQRKVGRVKVQKLLRLVGVSPSKTVGGLSERQRAELARAIATRAWRS